MKTPWTKRLLGFPRRKDDRLASQSFSSDRSAGPDPISEPQRIINLPADDDPPFGLKLLYLGNDPQIDIVAIHGLDGHREESWTSEKNGKLWLKDFLPETLPNSRIWTWGYDSRTRSKTHGDHLSTKKLYDHGRDLVYDLDGERRESKTHQRPIIIIAHSLGGIIVKNALLHSDRARKGHLEKERSIKLSTYGIIFMGTPHQGGRGVSIGKILLNLVKIRGNTSNGLLKHLEEHSELLQQQQADFLSISRDFDINFAYETKPCPILGGIAVEIVPKWSAVVPGTPDAADFGIDDDHKGMTKFSRKEDQGYKKLSRALVSMAQKAELKIRSNWIEEESKNQVILGSHKYAVPFSIQGVPLMSKLVSRNVEMTKMKELLQPGTKNTHRRSLVLHGLGGIGKTQLSLAFAREHQDKYTATFWLDGQTRESLERSIVGIARQLPPNQVSELARNYGPSGSEDIDMIIREVMDWFKAPGNTEWLLIYDNVDRDHSPETQDPDSYDLGQFLPSIDRGSVIITTRRSQLRQYGTDIEILGMTADEALEVLVHRISPSARDDPDVLGLIARLGNLPLALAQAGSYMWETATSISDYLESYKSTWNDLMKEEARYPLQEYGSRHVHTTWTISFTYVLKKNKAAARMLQLWACLNHRDIWLELFNNEESADLLRKSSLPTWFEWAFFNVLNFRNSVSTLLAYSLIEKRQDLNTGFSYSVHPVVHRWCYETLETKERHDLAFLAIRCVGFAVPTEHKREYRKIQIRLIPHADQCSYLLDSLEERLRNEEFTGFYGAIHNLGILYFDQGKLAEAEAMYMRALRGKEKAWGPDHTSTLNTVNNLGDLYTDQGKLAEAEAMYMRALRGKEKAWGPDHTSTLDTVNNLGTLYSDQGKLAEAEARYLRALNGYEKAWGPDHTSTLNTVNNLGTLYSNQGKLAEAETMYVRALNGYEKAWAPDHTSTLDTVNNLGALYSDQGKLAEAEAMCMRALKGKEKAWGPDHTSTLNAVYNLGILYSYQGKLAEAETMVVRALEGYVKAVGPEHPNVVRIARNLQLVREIRRIRAK